MGLAEAIRHKAFLGREFLTWLWFRAERDGRLALDSDPPEVAIELLGPIALDAPYGDARVTALRGESPAASPEARTALIEGKKLARARMKWTRGDAEWTATLDGETLAVSGLSMPATGRLPFAEAVAMRLAWAQEFEQTLGELFERFVALRLDARAWDEELRAIRAWVGRG